MWCPECDEENYVTHQKLSHSDALLNTEVLVNYFEKNIKPQFLNKMTLGNMLSRFRRKMNEKRNQTSIESYLTIQWNKFF